MRVPFSQLIVITSSVMARYQITFGIYLVSQSGHRVLNQCFTEISHHFTKCSMVVILRVSFQLKCSVHTAAGKH